MAVRALGRPCNTKTNPTSSSSATHPLAPLRRRTTPLMGMAASSPARGAMASSGSVCAAAAASAASSPSSPALLLAAAASDAAPLPPSSVLRDRLAGAVWGALAADALAMPVHWFYNPQDIVKLGGVGGRFPYGEDGEGEGVGGDNDKDAPASSYYRAPPPIHPGSIMSLHSTGGQGRGSQSGSVIGDVINHGKKQYWGKPGTHYHNVLKSGDNTLNALCLRLTARCVAGAPGGSYSSPEAGGDAGHARRFLQAYVDFMTTPGSHDDTYAESFHRAWFGNWARGVPAEKCAKGTQGHDDSQIGGFVMIPPVALAAAVDAARQQGQQTPAEARRVAEEAAARASVAHLRLTHDSPKLEAVAARYGALLARVALAPVVIAAAPDAAAPLGGEKSTDGDHHSDLSLSLLQSASASATALLKSEAAKEALKGVSGAAGIRPLDVSELAAFSDTPGSGWDDVRVLHRVTGPACYIESSWPAVLYLSARHADPSKPAAGFKKAVEANANAGGENCHRGAALGALVGLAAGERFGVPRAMREGKGGLREGAAIREEVDAFVSAAVSGDE